MGLGLTTVLIVLIICVSVLIGVYMTCCQESGVKMFSGPRYEERIKEPEKRVKDLEDKA